MIFGSVADVEECFARNGHDGRLLDFKRFDRANSLSDVIGSLFLRRCRKRFALTLWGFQAAKDIFIQCRDQTHLRFSW
jgi:hypothetical protein